MTWPPFRCFMATSSVSQFSSTDAVVAKRAISPSERRRGRREAGGGTFLSSRRYASSLFRSQTAVISSSSSSSSSYPFALHSTLTFRTRASRRRVGPAAVSDKSGQAPPKRQAGRPSWHFVAPDSIPCLPSSRAPSIPADDTSIRWRHGDSFKGIGRRTAANERESSLFTDLIIIVGDWRKRRGLNYNTITIYTSTIARFSICSFIYGHLIASNAKFPNE